MEWIGCTVCEIFAFKLYCDLETGVWGHSVSSKEALFDREHTTLYSSSIVTMPLLPFPFRDRATYWSKKRYPLVFGARVRDQPVRLRGLHKKHLVTKTRMIGLTDSERISTTRSAVLIQSTHVTDGRTDKRNCRGIGQRAIACCRA